LIFLVKLFFGLIHEIPDRVGDDGFFFCIT